MARVRAIMLLCLIASRTVTQGTRIDIAAKAIKTSRSMKTEASDPNPFQKNSTSKSLCRIRWAPGATDAGSQEANLKAEVTVWAKNKISCSGTSEHAANRIFPLALESQKDMSNTKANTCKCVLKAAGKERAKELFKMDVHHNDDCNDKESKASNGVSIMSTRCWNYYMRLRSSKEKRVMTEGYDSSVLTNGLKQGLEGNKYSNGIKETVELKSSQTLQFDLEETGSDAFFYESVAGAEASHKFESFLGDEDRALDFTLQVLSSKVIDKTMFEWLSALGDDDRDAAFEMAFNKLPSPTPPKEPLLKRFRSFLGMSAEQFKGPISIENVPEPVDFVQHISEALSKVKSVPEDSEAAASMIGAALQAEESENEEWKTFLAKLGEYLRPC